MEMKKIVLTGDRPTGPLHVGHYVGSLQQRVQLQERHTQYVMIADVQALTDNTDAPEKVRAAVHQVMLDYLAVGIDPKKTTIFIQSLIPYIAELTVFYLNLVTVNRLKRNPTVKTEIQQKSFGENVTAGFLMYPVSQAADITIFKGEIVPVGEDQLPVIEQTNELVRAFNRTYKSSVLKEAEGLVSAVPRLVGIDGKSKMSKSLGNAIFLSDDVDSVKKKVMSMYTDPDHVRVQDPGRVEGNAVFVYLDVFDPDKKMVEELKLKYQHGGLGDVVLKRRLIEIMEAFLDPIRTRRAEYAQDMHYIDQILKEGTEHAYSVAEETMREIRMVMKLDYF